MLYAHYDNKIKKGQILNEHLNNVQSRMLDNISAVKFKLIEENLLKEILSNIGYYHDIGKIMNSFQKYLQTEQGGNEKNHSLISAGVFSAKYNNSIDMPTYLAMLSIAKHHVDMESEFDINEHNYKLFFQLPKQYEDIKKQVENNQEYAKILENTFDLENYKKCIEENIIEIQSKRNISNNGVEPFFILQYFFSKLLWADKLDSANLFQENKNITTLESIENYIKTKNNIKLAVTERREDIRLTALKQVDILTDEEFSQTGIFQLTAPTGTGKTLTSICVALKIKERMQKQFGYSGQIITALPFINILEQTKSDYESFFTDVLTHYSGVDLNTSSKNNEDENTLQEKLLLMSAWESPVIITTFVQFFESILTNKNNRLIKFNKLAGSVVILDEIQTIPSVFAPLLGAIIKYLTVFYGTRFILMTATQPEIVEAANKLLPQNYLMTAHELLPNHQKYYDNLTRTKLVNVFSEVTNNEELVEFIKKTKGDNKAALVVVNTIRQSIEVYKMLKQEYKVLYLSTNLIAIDRKKVIDQAKMLLSKKESFVLVSTQTIEAGVDLDFDIGYRDLAPLESIIQVAGRINRSGDKGTYVPLYMFNTKSSVDVYQQYPQQETYEILKQYKSIGEDQYLAIVKSYYQKISLSPYDEDIYKAMHFLDFKKIKTFSLIKNQENVKTVLIIKAKEVDLKANEYAEILKRRFLSFEEKAMIKQLLKELSRYTVDIRIANLVKNRPCTFSDVYGVNLDWYVVQFDELKNYYNETGFTTESPQAFVY